MATTSQSEPESAEAPAQFENLGSLTLDEISPETLRHMRLSQLLRVREIGIFVAAVVIFALLALGLWFSLARPLMRRHLGPPVVTAAGSGKLTGAGESQDDQEEEERIRAAAVKARQQSRYDDNLQTARELAERDPRAVAAVLRSWMEKDDA